MTPYVGIKKKLYFSASVHVFLTKFKQKILSYQNNGVISNTYLYQSKILGSRYWNPSQMKKFKFEL